MFHYGCSINDLREQKEAFQCAFDALKSIQSDVDPTDCLFIYPINREYQVCRHFLDIFHFFKLSIIFRVSITAEFEQWWCSFDWSERMSTKISHYFSDLQIKE